MKLNGKKIHIGKAHMKPAKLYQIFNNTIKLTNNNN